MDNGEGNNDYEPKNSLALSSSFDGIDVTFTSSPSVTPRPGSEIDPPTQPTPPISNERIPSLNLPQVSMFTEIQLSEEEKKRIEDGQSQVPTSLSTKVMLEVLSRFQSKSSSSFAQDVARTVVDLTKVVLQQKDLFVSFPNLIKI
jgi:hypothetical protein